MQQCPSKLSMRYQKFEQNFVDTKGNAKEARSTGKDVMGIQRYVVSVLYYLRRSFINCLIYILTSTSLIFMNFKEPRTALFVPEWNYLLGPRTLFIHTIRDGRDCALGTLSYNHVIESFTCLLNNPLYIPISTLS